MLYGIALYYCDQIFKGLLGWTRRSSICVAIAYPQDLSPTEVP